MFETYEPTTLERARPGRPLKCLVCGREPPPGSVLCREHAREWAPRLLLSEEDTLARQLRQLATR